MRKRLTALFASAAIAISVVGMVGCGGAAKTDKADNSKSEAATQSSSQSSQTGDVSDGDEVTLTMWTWSPITRTAQKMIKAFEEKNPKIHIEYTNYNRAFDS